MKKWDLYNYGQDLKDYKKNGEEKEFSALPRNEKFPTKKEYFEKTGTKSNKSKSHGASNSSNHFASSKVTQPLFVNYVDVGNRG